MILNSSHSLRKYGSKHDLYIDVWLYISRGHKGGPYKVPRPRDIETGPIRAKKSVLVANIGVILIGLRARKCRVTKEALQTREVEIFRK